MGGKFVLILDDAHYRLQRCETNPAALRLNEVVDRYAEALDWLGCPPDRIGMSSEADDLMREAMDALSIKEPQIVEPETNYGIMFTRVGKFGNEILQYTPWTTLSGVVDHRYFGVTGFVRGWELVGEAFLYDYLHKQLGWVAPEQWYVPVVRRGWSYTKESNSDTGARTGATLLELKQQGVTGEEIIDTLRELDFRREQESRDCINIPMDLLCVPQRPGTLAYHLKEVAT
jgi:glutamyl/glutaminyl-tRNA synthetase